jgi:hypothetical protein
MTPKSRTGAKTAERVPMTTRASPRRMRPHSSKRSPAVSDEWKMATASPKCARSRREKTGVSAISGTSIIAERPCLSAERIARM